MASTLFVAGSTAHAQAGADEALVVFHRPNVMKAKATRFNLEQNGRPIGQLLAGTTIEVPLAPGTYTFTVSAISVDGMDSITLNVEAGKTYRVKGEVMWGWPAGRPKFTDVGKAGLMNFRGDWTMEMWSLTADGRKLEGNGTVTGMPEGDNGTRIVITEFDSPHFPDATGGGRVLLSYEPGKGFLLESDLRVSDKVLKLTGQYQADGNKYVFYLIGGGGETMSGVPRASVRIEISSLDTRTWVADTYAAMGGQSTHVQSSRFTRR